MHYESEDRQRTAPLKWRAKERVKRFMKHVSKTNTCWEWTGALNNSGYGIFNAYPKLMTAHRFSYILFKGNVKKGFDVCHSCDNRKCVNPKHLWQGTRKENMKDASQKGRIVLPLLRGEKHPGSKLNEHKVIDILKSWQSAIQKKEKMDFKKISKIYGVSVQNIRLIVARKTWSHVRF